MYTDQGQGGARSWPRSTEGWFVRVELPAASGKADHRSSFIRSGEVGTDDRQLEWRGLVGRHFDRSSHVWAPQGYDAAVLERGASEPCDPSTCIEPEHQTHDLI